MYKEQLLEQWQDHPSKQARAQHIQQKKHRRYGIVLQKKSCHSFLLHTMDFQIARYFIPETLGAHAYIHVHE